MSRSSEKTNKKGPRKWVPRNKLFFLADVIIRLSKIQAVTSSRI
jgi:hypothetical protein